MRGATWGYDKGANFGGFISIHAPHAGSDRDQPSDHCRDSDFNPRSPCGERLKNVRQNVQFDISIHAPHAGSDGTILAAWIIIFISIHAPHAGSDVCLPLKEKS